MAEERMDDGSHGRRRRVGRGSDTMHHQNTLASIIDSLPEALSDIHNV